MAWGFHIEPSGALSEVCPGGQEEVHVVEGTVAAKAWHGSDAHEKGVPKGTASWETLAWPCVPVGTLDFFPREVVGSLQGHTATVERDGWDYGS